MDGTRAHQLRWATLGVLCVSLLIIGLDNTILNTALPRLTEDLDATQSQVQWIVDSYTLVFAGLLLTAGSLGDRFGRRRALNAGLIVFGIASVAAALSQDPGQLIAARGLMGLGGALVMPSTLSILTNSFTDENERKKAIGVWAGVSGLGIAFGPALGGWLLDHYWWGSVFLINIPVVVAGLVLGSFLVPESRDPAAPKLDPLGALFSTAGLSALIWSIIEAPEMGWTSGAVLGGFAASAVLLAAFGAWELRYHSPMLDLRFFANPRFSAAAVSITFVFFALFGSVFVLPTYMQGVLGYSPLEAGIRIMPIAIGLVFGAPLAMQAAARIGEKIPTVVGLVLLAASLFVLSGTTIDSGYGRVFTVLTLMGLGMGIAMAPATEAVMGSLPKEKAGVGSAVNDTTRQVGGALGVAVLGSVLSSAYGDRMDSKVAALPEPAAEAASDNLLGAAKVAEQVGGPVGTQLVDAAERAFVHGMDVTTLVAAGVAFAGALVALVWLPSHAKDIDDLDTELAVLSREEAVESTP
jgi:EmrB/QacA subfamily drug resistance transporter